ncbi:MAG: 3-phosphoshikimate 1-carboxyvinyltransferase, partial [Syntrophomonadaceae bacterium]|nr:3-phosphoshikimate 1-carboxyvinyltransferase [Syntrophomonadaceae bacterium]
ILQPVEKLEPLEINVPGDISSAAFFLVAATVVPGSELLLTRVGINPTRSGIIRVLREMGAKIQVLNERLEGGEPVGDIFLTSSPLKGTSIDEELIPSLIDELPVLAVAMAVAEGDSRVSGASELRVKETDRIKAVCTNLAMLGVDITETEDGFVVRGGRGISGGSVESFGDHRIAMAMGVAGLVSHGELKLRGAEAVAVSYPEFWSDLARAASR